MKNKIIINITLILLFIWPILGALAMDFTPMLYAIGTGILLLIAYELLKH